MALDLGAMDIAGIVQMLQRAAARAQVLEEGADGDPMELVQGAQPEHWPHISALFLEYGVPFDKNSGVGDLYRATLGLLNPHSFIPVLVLPMVGASVQGEEVWDMTDPDGLMEEQHLWPQEALAEGEPEAFAYLMVGYGHGAALTVCDTGLWSAQPYSGDGGPLPDHADFTLTFAEAFRHFAARQIEGWAEVIAETYRGWDGRDPAVPAAVCAELVAPGSLAENPTVAVQVWTS